MEPKCYRVKVQLLYGRTAIPIADDDVCKLFGLDPEELNIKMENGGKLSLKQQQDYIDAKLETLAANPEVLDLVFNQQEYIDRTKVSTEIIKKEYLTRRDDGSGFWFTWKPIPCSNIQEPAPVDPNPNDEPGDPQPVPNPDPIIIPNIPEADGFKIWTTYFYNGRTKTEKKIDAIGPKKVPIPGAKAKPSFIASQFSKNYNDIGPRQLDPQEVADCTFVATGNLFMMQLKHNNDPLAIPQNFNYPEKVEVTFDFTRDKISISYDYAIAIPIVRAVIVTSGDGQILSHKIVSKIFTYSPDNSIINMGVQDYILEYRLAGAGQNKQWANYTIPVQTFKDKLNVALFNGLKNLKLPDLECGPGDDPFFILKFPTAQYQKAVDDFMKEQMNLAKEEHILANDCKTIYVTNSLPTTFNPNNEMFPPDAIQAINSYFNKTIAYTATVSKMDGSDSYEATFHPLSPISEDVRKSVRAAVRRANRDLEKGAQLSENMFDNALNDPAIGLFMEAYGPGLYNPVKRR